MPLLPSADILYCLGLLDPDDDLDPDDELGPSDGLILGALDARPTVGALLPSGSFQLFFVTLLIAVSGVLPSSLMLRSM